MTLPLAYHDKGRTVRMGILGFSLGLGLVSLTAMAMGQSLDPDMERLTMAFVYGMGGLFAGMLLGSTLRAKRASLSFAIMGALGLGGGYYLSQLVIDQVDPGAISPFLGPELGPLALPFLQALVIGLVTGLLLGLAQGRAGLIARGALAGALGLGLAFILQAALYAPLLNMFLAPIISFISRGSVALFVPMLLSWAIAGALGGALAGAIIGDAMA